MLHIGQAIYTNLYNLGLGYICAIHEYEESEKLPVQQLCGGVGASGGSCDVDIIFLDGRKTKRYPECLIGSQFKLQPDREDATPDLLSELEALSIEYYAQKAAQEKQKENEFNNAMSDFRDDPQFKKLTQVDQSNKYDYKTIKGNYQKLLKMYFPKTKFKLRKYSWLGITVQWEGLPTRGQFNDKMDCMKEANNVEQSLISDCNVSQKEPFSSVFGCFEYVNIYHSFDDHQVQTAIDALVNAGGYMLPAPTLEEYRKGKAFTMQCITNCPETYNWNWEKLINKKINELK